jgi:hypothetical protein
VYDGRAGRRLTVLPRGARPLDTHRPDATALDEFALRKSIITTSRPKDDNGGPLGKHQTPEDHWVDAQKVVQLAAAEMNRATQALHTVRTANGQRFTETMGFRDQDVNDHIDAVQKALHALDFQREIYLRQQGVGDDELGEQDGHEAD